MSEQWSPLSADGSETDRAEGVAVDGAPPDAGRSAWEASLGPAADDPALELREVRAAYGKIEVLHGVDLVVPRGGVVALLGPNGAGKSTTIKVASGQMSPTAGALLVADRFLNWVAPSALSRAGVCTIPEGRGVFPNLTVHENLRMATWSGSSLREIEERAYARFPRLGERRHQLAGTMSGGEQQMLSMARALASDPAVLLIDELSMGLAPKIVEDLYGQVAQIAAEGISILIVEQFARTVMEVADVVGLMLSGHMVQVGRPEELERELSRAYLGVQLDGERAERR